MAGSGGGAGSLLPRGDAAGGQLKEGLKASRRALSASMRSLGTATAKLRQSSPALRSTRGGSQQPTALGRVSCLPARFLRRSAPDDGAEQQALRDFFQVMLGQSGLDRGAESVPRPGALNGRLCLEELSVQSTAKLCKDFAMPPFSSGLARALQPQLEDLLLRRQDFRKVVDYLASASDGDDSLPRVLAELTPKDLFLVLLLATSRRRNARLASVYSSLHAPLPIVFRVVPKPGSDVRTLAAFDMLHELACVPAAGRQLLVSLGTQLSVAGGKTQLLGALQLCTSGESQLDVRPGGPMHLASCDLTCSEGDRWVADVHGHWCTSDEDLRASVLALSLWGSAVCIVHCAPGDFNAKSGLPSKDLSSILDALLHTTLPMSVNRTMQARTAGVVLLLRDTTADTFTARKEQIETCLPQAGILSVIPVEDCRHFRSNVRRVSALEKVKHRIEDVIQRRSPSVVSSLEELYAMHKALMDGKSHTATSSSAPPPQDAPTIVQPSALGREFMKLLDICEQTGATASALFPLTAINRRLLALRADAKSGPPRARGIEELRREEESAQARERQIQTLERQLVTEQISKAVSFFLRLASTSDFAGLSELTLYLDSWKTPRVKPLMDRQREILDKQASPTASQGGKASKEEESLEEESKSVYKKLMELDFSVHSFWAELELLALRSDGPPDEARKVKSDFSHGSKAPKHTDANSPLGQAMRCLQVLLGDGYPFQVLHGRPLQMGGHFLRQTLESIGATHEENSELYVVSVIGAQSSAKSTLLNFLFGCDFAVHAGRCTRGLYASYLRPAGSPPILVLDSEGLLSLGSEGSVFDGQIALMCMACSHLVLVNNKGELSRQLQDLLEICLFAMQKLQFMRQPPRLMFVLRDQHDRSRAVHEDMLKQMKRHLDETARMLGLPLNKLILLDGTAVALLPSAFNAELRAGREIAVTSQLFANEVLILRQEIFRCLKEDSLTRRKQGNAAEEFGSLTQWYDYASSVWETLVQFGGQLLHYKTIHEIELRRELADVAKNVVRDALEGTHGEESARMTAATSGGMDRTTLGFHAKARLMVDNFADRLHVNVTQLDLDKINLEFSRALACLRDECIAQLEELFLERTVDPRFSAAAKEDTKQQMKTPIEWAFENHLYTWKLHLKKASDEREIQQLWMHFTGVLNDHLTNTGHRSCLSEAESRALFDSEWMSYEAAFLTRLRSLTKDWHTLSHEVTLLFNHAVGKLQHEVGGALALLKEIGPQQVALPPSQRKQAGLTMISEQTDDEWEECYLHIGWWASMKKRGLAFLQTDSGSEAAPASSGAKALIPRMRQVVTQGLQTFAGDVRSRGSLDEATCAEGLRHITGEILQQIEYRLLQDCSVTLKRPQVLQALQVALRIGCIEALVQVEGDKQTKAVSDLLDQKAYVEEHFLLIIQENRDEVKCATNFAQLYHRSLEGWVENEVTRLAANVRNQVLQEMPDPQKSSDRAFQMSFAAQSWPDVLEYVLDESSYLEKLFLTLFHQRKKAIVGSSRAQLEKRVLRTYRLLQDLALQWARQEQATLAATTPTGTMEKDVLKGPTTARDQKSVKELKDYIVVHAERGRPGSDSGVETFRHLAERMPQSADFRIADPKLFVDTFHARLGDILDGQDVPERLMGSLRNALQEQSIQAWSLIRGCSERCPLCGSKCDIVGEHTRHHCSHHLFPAFHGWMDRETGLPSFNHCMAQSTLDGRYECKDGTWRHFKEYLLQDHPSWLPFNRRDEAASEKDLLHLQAAWVNCRAPLLQFYCPMVDSCPEEWQDAHYDEKRALKREDLKAAKDTIRRLRDRTWAPEDDD